MRIVLAYDGSRGAETAVQLLASLHWEADTRVRAVTVLPPRRPLLGRAGGVEGLGAVNRTAEATVVRDLRAAVATLASAGLAGDRRLPRGRPAQAIVTAARRFRADLVVAGSRGRGALASMLLGSVAAELVDASHRPVLIARAPSLGTTVLATDGSRTAIAAEEFLIRSGLAHSVVVVYVDDVGRRWPSELASEDAVRQRLDYEMATAATTLRRLNDAGVVGELERRSGDPAGEIIAAAQERRANLIVVGTRGHTGIKRLVLGSVARNVLHSSPTSVLVVPPRTR